MKNQPIDKMDKLTFNLVNAKNQEKLIKTLGQISGLGEKASAESDDPETLKQTMQVQEKVAEAYEKAVELVNTDSRFAELKNLTKLFKVSASNWRSKAGFSRSRSIDRSISKGNALYASGKYSEAIQCYDKSLKIDPENSYALLNKGLALINLGNLEPALKYFDLALSKTSVTETPEPGTGVSEMAHLGKGKVYLELERFAEAKTEFETVLSINQRSVEALNGLSAVCQDGLYDYDRAIKLEEQVLELDPQSIEAKANLAETLLATNNYGRSEQLAADLLLNRPEEIGYPMRLVKVCTLYFQDRTDEAKTAALDLLEYYKSISKKQDTNWNFRGLKNVINNKDSPKQVKQILLSFIGLAEPTDQSKKIELVTTMKETLTAPRILSRLLMRRTVSEIGQSIRIKNTSTPDTDNPGWYLWEIFLTPQEALDDVKNVTYTLHKTFLDPVRLVTERATGFRLRSRGWGEFTVKVDICFNNDERITKYHWLQLGPTPLDRE